MNQKDIENLANRILATGYGQNSMIFVMAMLTTIEHVFKHEESSYEAKAIICELLQEQTDILVNKMKN